VTASGITSGSATTTFTDSVVEIRGSATAMVNQALAYVASVVACSSPVYTWSLTGPAGFVSGAPAPPAVYWAALGVLIDPFADVDGPTAATTQQG
jgi:hypothetical protein